MHISRIMVFHSWFKILLFRKVWCFVSVQRLNRDWRRAGVSKLASNAVTPWKSSHCESCSNARIRMHRIDKFRTRTSRSLPVRYFLFLFQPNTSRKFVSVLWRQSRCSRYYRPDIFRSSWKFTLHIFVITYGTVRIKRMTRKKILSLCLQYF